MILAIVFLAFSVRAQMKPVWGVAGGLNLSGISAENYVESHRKLGAYLGLWSEFPISSTFWLQTELLYATYGGNVTIQAVPSSIDVEYDMDYLMLPVVGKYDMHRNFYLEFGASVNLLVRKKGYRPGAPDIVDEDGNFVRSQSEIDPDVNRFEVCALAGLSYKINQKWTLRFRYTRAVSRSFIYSGDYSVPRNDAFQLGVGYTF